MATPFLVPAAGAVAPHELTREELLARALFHGTAEPIEGPLHGGGYDGVLWTVDCPAIAQTYVPEAGITAFWSGDEWLADDVVVPEGTTGRLACQMGYVAEVLQREGDRPHGRVRSWRYTQGPEGPGLPGTPVPSPRHRDVLRYVRDVLGYAPSAGTKALFELKERSRGEDGGFEFMPASYRMSGALYVLLPQEPLRLYDLAAGREGDLTALEYQKHEVFGKAAVAGFDGVRINDFMQSPSQGNYGHVSLGLLPAGIAKVTATPVPCTHFDYGTLPRGHTGETPDFIAGHGALVAAAMARGETVRPEVRDVYPELIADVAPAAVHR